MSDALAITPVRGPVRGRIRPPGSKSLTNRALVCAALAEGTSQLAGVLESRDTEVMLDSLTRLGIDVRYDRVCRAAHVTGCNGGPPAAGAELWLENSGTSIRFLTAVCALGRGRFRLDGNSRMRERPIGNLVAALNQLGAAVRCESDNDCPPVIVEADGLPGGTARISGTTSSQYLSALLMAAPRAASNVVLELQGDLVSEPYVGMTLRVMGRFGIDVDTGKPGQFRIAPQTYSAADYEIEPDASAASYFFALAAVTGGEVTVEGLSRDSLQGDVRFVDVLAEMGCHVEHRDDGITVAGGKLRGVDVDMGDISDTAQTLAVVAAFAESPTRIRNIAHVRHKETDRIAAVARELRRAGVRADEHADGLTIYPGAIHPATIETYDDHRMAMSFALLGVRYTGIEIANPGCTGKTYPAFFSDLETLLRTAR
jgi:3-phosphoshikimate 1-carboxyvinyltransferase